MLEGLNPLSPIGLPSQIGPIAPVSSPFLAPATAPVQAPAPSPVQAPVPSPVQAPAPSSAGTTGPIVLGSNTNFCWDVLVTAGAQNIVPGETVNLQNCDNLSTQLWTVGNGTAFKVNNFCLDVVNGQPATGAFLEANTCSGSASQQWSVLGHQVQSGNSGLCVDILGEQIVDRMSLVLQLCGNQPTQSWNLP